VARPGNVVGYLFRKVHIDNAPVGMQHLVPDADGFVPVWRPAIITRDRPGTRVDLTVFLNAIHDDGEYDVQLDPETGEEVIDPNTGEPFPAGHWNPGTVYKTNVRKGTNVGEWETQDVVWPVGGGPPPPLPSPGDDIEPR